MTAFRNELPTEQQFIYDQAVTGAGRVYAEGIARQDARPAHEAAVEALGRTATAAQIDAWLAAYRPAAQHRSTA